MAQGSVRACISTLHNMTTTKTTVAATTVTKTTKTSITKAELKKTKAEKRTVGKEAQSANAKKNAAAMKKKGVGLFAPKKLSDALAAICGAKTLPRTEVTKKVWVYIKKNQLNEGRVIKPDAALKAVMPVASVDMLKMASFVSKHLS